MKIEDLVPNLLVQTSHRELLKVSNIYPHYVTMQVLLPAPGRTTVRTYRPEEMTKWRKPSRALLNQYDDEYGVNLGRR